MSGKKIELPIFSKEAPSEEMMKCFETEGSVSIDCEMCGRVHITGDWNCDSEKDEAKEIAKWESNPEKYVLLLEHNTVHYGYYRGRQVVPDCPCRFLRIVEEEWWEHRGNFLNYLKDVYGKRGKGIRREEEQLKNTLEIKDSE